VEAVSDDPKLCARCDDEPVGPGQILCLRCAADLESRGVEFWYEQALADED
jgi:hypothetical protein